MNSTAARLSPILTHVRLACDELTVGNGQGGTCMLLLQQACACLAEFTCACVSLLAFHCGAALALLLLVGRAQQLLLALLRWAPVSAGWTRTWGPAQQQGLILASQLQSLHGRQVACERPQLLPH